MARMQWIGVLAVSVLLSGCVAQDKYNALRLEKDSLAEQLNKAQSDASAARSQADAYKSQLDALGSNGNSLQAMAANLGQENATLRGQLDELNRKYAEALNRPAGGVALPEPLSNALSEFARQNPELVDFDAARGIVKFKSDVTFSTGSADLTDKAKEVIAKFAGILNSPAAASYELMVAGHTDNTPVSRAETRAKHPDNWYLSAHRAISVGEALMSQGTSAQRLGVVGYADQKPVASNGSESGKAQNRRVEVLILSSTIRGGAVTGNGRSARPAMNKDAAAAPAPVQDVRPRLNK